MQTAEQGLRAWQSLVYRASLCMGLTPLQTIVQSLMSSLHRYNLHRWEALSIRWKQSLETFLMNSSCLHCGGIFLFEFFGWELRVYSIETRSPVFKSRTTASFSRASNRQESQSRLGHPFKISVNFYAPLHLIPTISL